MPGFLAHLPGFFIIKKILGFYSFERVIVFYQQKKKTSDTVLFFLRVRLNLVF